MSIVETNNIETNNYWIYDGKLIFKPNFNECINEHYVLLLFLSKIDTIIFSEYDNLRIFLKFSDVVPNMYHKNFVRSKFNKKIEFEKYINIINITKIIFPNSFNQDVKLKNYYGLKYLVFGHEFDSILELEEGLEYLSFGYNFNQNLILLKSLKYVKFGSNFDRLIILSQSLEQLIFGSCFNQPIELNNNLKQLTFGQKFNQYIQLNDNLTRLTFSNNFNQYIQLNNNLTHLTFGNDFNQPIQLNNKLIYLVLGSCFNQDICLCESLKYLEINCNLINIINYLPNNLTELVLEYNFKLELNDLPNSIKSIKFYNSNYLYQLNNLPNSVEYLELPNGYNLQINKFPNKLKKIKCDCNYKFVDDFANKYDIELNIRYFQK